MKLIVGLGNPGKKYENTRHNAGWLAIDCLTSTPLNPNKKFKAAIIKTTIKSQDIILAKPLTYMNNSGLAVAKISQYYKIKVSDIWIIHDDIDLLFGQLRVSQSRTSAGHRGVESIIQSIGTKDFIRFRFGIKPDQKKINTEKYVLLKFSKPEINKLPLILNTTKLAITQALQKGIKKTTYDCLA